MEASLSIIINIEEVEEYLSSSRCDVFISFRGEDTRRRFTSHLFHALTAKNISAYMDDKMKKGSEISPTLIEAIERAKLSVIVFSENYASSSWCLDELVQILECKENKNQIVVPIFYGVDPSHVRKQKGSYTISSERFEGRNPEVLDTWRRALTKAANLSGWDWSKFRLESKLIEKVVEDVKRKLEVLKKEEAAIMAAEEDEAAEAALNNKAANLIRPMEKLTVEVLDDVEENLEVLEEIFDDVKKKLKKKEEAAIMVAEAACIEASNFSARVSSRIRPGVELIVEFFDDF